MPLYEDRTNSENRINVKEQTRNSIVCGNSLVSEKILEIIQKLNKEKGRTVRVAVDGWYGVDWTGILSLINNPGNGLDILVENLSGIFKSNEEINQYKKEFLTDDPGFGWSNTEGRIMDIIDPSRLDELKSRLESANQTDAIIVIGYGSTIQELNDSFDIRFYADMTQQQMLWQMWDGKLVPFGRDRPKSDYYWKEYYYCDFYLLHNHKHFAFSTMQYYLDVTDSKEIKLLPKPAFDDILSTMVKYPVKQVKIFQPGPWGAYRYKDLFDVDGLECNAWNELVGPELNILIDIGGDCLINMPVANLLEHGKEFVGPYIDKHFPGMIPFDVWLDDGYFPEPVSQERSSMPIHSHPSMDYVKHHFNEPLGRYETYYIAEAYEGANTMMGFKKDADLEEWEAKCRESWAKKEPIPDWKEYIKIWPTNVGDLFLIPPGTTHGHGGNQMVLEMDTVCSPCGTEYSFFTYDFMRPSWDDMSKTMTAKPMNLHLEHGFDNDKWRNEDYVDEKLRVRQPEVIKWTKEYAIDRYQMIKEMPFEIERLHFTESGEYDTQGLYMHIPTLTVGKRVKIRSKFNPEWEAEINQWQACMIPAGFGKYECINMGEGACTLVFIRWKKG
ncbi:MAG: hypothetical protein ABFS38_01545 [Bacteroidota bacterium]